MSGGSIMDAGTTSTAAVLASGAFGSDMQVADSSARGGCSGIGLPLRIPGGCPYDAGTGWFVCAGTGRDGLTRTFKYQYRDAAGSAQSAYDSLTASIQVVSSRQGTITHGNVTRTVHDDLDLTIRGLAGNETTRVWNGTGSSSRADGTGTFIMQSTTTLADVVVPAPFTRDAWPLSGSVTTHLVMMGGIDQPSVLTFNGTRYATLTVNGTSTTVDLGRWLRDGSGAGMDDDRHHGPGRP